MTSNDMVIIASSNKQIPPESNIKDFCKQFLINNFRKKFSKGYSQLGSRSVLFNEIKLRPTALFKIISLFSTVQMFY